MDFANFEYLFLFVLLVPYIIWYMINRGHSTPSMRISTTESFFHAPKSFRQHLIHLPFLCRIICLSCAIIALARPQTTNNWSNKTVEGNDKVVDVYSKVGIQACVVVDEYVYCGHYYAGYPQVDTCAVFQPQVDDSCYYSQKFKHAVIVCKWVKGKKDLKDFGDFKDFTVLFVRF